MKLSVLQASSRCNSDQSQELGDYYTWQLTIPVKPSSKEDCYSSYPISLTRSETALRCFQGTIKARHWECRTYQTLFMAQRFALFLTEIQGKKGKKTFPGILLRLFLKEQIRMCVKPNIAHIKCNKKENYTIFSRTYQKFFGWNWWHSMHTMMVCCPSMVFP